MKRKSGLADSPFFAPPPQPVEPGAGIVFNSNSSVDDTTIPRHHDTVIPRYHDTIIEQVRKAVKEFGKEAATHRFTLTEKRTIADILHEFGKQGLKTSENEIARIAINYLIENFKEEGQDSILVKTIKALRE